MTGMPPSAPTATDGGSGVTGEVAGPTALMRSVRDENLFALLRRLVAEGPAGRKQLALDTGISSTTVTRLTAGLVRAGVLVEHPLVERTDPVRAGRPERPLGLASGTRFVAGVHIRPHQVSCSAFDLTGQQVFSRASVPDGTSPDQVVPHVADAVLAVGAALGADALLGVAVSTGGEVDPERGVVVHSPQLGWREVDVRERLGDLGVRVLIDNSVRCLAIGQTWDGRTPTGASVLTAYLDNAVGSALVVDGRLHRGHRALAGGLDHQLVRPGWGVRCECGDLDCLAATVTNPALQREAVRRGLVSESARWLPGGRTADEGPTLVALRAERARMFGDAVGRLAGVVAPDLVVIAGLLGSDEDVAHCLNAVRSAAAFRRIDPDGQVIFRATTAGSWDRLTATVVLDDFVRHATGYLPSLLG